MSADLVLPNRGCPPPAEDAPHAEWAVFYTQQWDFGLTYMERGEKGPNHHGWNRDEQIITDPAAAEAHWRLHRDHNLGGVLSVSGRVTFDGDGDAWQMDLALEAVGLNRELILAAGAQLQGRPERCKAMFAVPEGVSLVHRQLKWPSPTPKGKPVTIFELRAGAIQDVLPPSLHPEGMHYRWIRGPWEMGGFPPVPADLLDLWRNWDQRLPLMLAARPWELPPEVGRPARSPSRRAHASTEWDAIRAEIRRRVPLTLVLEQIGAEPARGKNVFFCPFHEEDSPSFWTFSVDDHNRWLCAHGGAPVGFNTKAEQSSGDVIDLFAFAHQMSVGEATAHLAHEMGISLPARRTPQLVLRQPIATWSRLPQTERVAGVRLSDLLGRRI
jgi:hypothetical protein